MLAVVSLALERLVSKVEEEEEGGFISPIAFSNAARTECSVEPAYTGRLSSV